MVAVSPYAISYINHTGKVRTAWTVREKVPNGGSRLVVAVEDGLPAFPVKPTTIEVA